MIWWNNCKDPTLCCPLYHCGQGFWDRKTFLLQKHHLLVVHFFSTSCYQRKLPFWELFFVYYFTTQSQDNPQKQATPSATKEEYTNAYLQKYIIVIQHRPHQSITPPKINVEAENDGFLGRCFFSFPRGVFSGSQPRDPVGQLVQLP